MGLSIKESLKWLISRKEHYEMDDNCQELAQALDTAINTMRKYQKIEKIIKNAGIFAFDVPEIRRIAEVMKDE